MSITLLIKPKESFIQSAFKDLVTFSFMAFCIYISQGSTFWTFLTGLLFMTLLFLKVAAIISETKNEFTCAEEAKEYIDNNMPN